MSLRGASNRHLMIIDPHHGLFISAPARLHVVKANMAGKLLLKLLLSVVYYWNWSLFSWRHQCISEICQKLLEDILIFKSLLLFSTLAGSYLSWPDDWVMWSGLIRLSPLFEKNSTFSSSEKPCLHWGLLLWTPSGTAKNLKGFLRLIQIISLCWDLYYLSAQWVFALILLYGMLTSYCRSWQHHGWPYIFPSQQPISFHFW